MKRFYISLVLFGLIGLAAGYLIHPSRQEVALMYFKDRHYGKAQQLYKDLLEEGLYSPSVVRSLAVLNLREGNIEQSIVLLKEFIKSNPKSIVARKQITQYYKDAQRPKEYLKALEELNSFNNSQETLQELSSLYHSFNQLENHIKTLEKVIIEPNYTIRQEDYRQLIVYYATLNEYEKALTIGKELLKKTNYMVNHNLFTAILEIALQIEEESKDALLMVNSYISSLDGDKPEIITDLIEFFIARSDFKTANMLTGGLIKGDSPPPRLLALHYKIMILQNNEEQAYTELKELFKKQTLSPPLNNILARLSLKFKDYMFSKNVISASEQDSFTEKTILDYIEVSILTGDKEIASILRSKLSRAYLEGDLVLSMLLSFAEHGDDIKALVSKVHKKQYLDNESKILIMNICYERGKKKLSYEIQKTLPLFYLITNSDHERVADQIVIYGDVKLRLQEINKLIGKKKEIALLVETLIFISSGSGNESVIRRTIAQHPQLPQEVIRDSYFIASKHNQPQTAIYLARLLRSGYPQSQSNVYVANSLIESKKYEQAMDQVGQMYTNNTDAEACYRNALSKLVIASNGHLSAELKTKFKAFTEYSTSRADLTDEQIRNLGYLFADAGENDKAAKLFKQLSKGQNAVTDDVKQLVFLWGDKPEASQIEWLLEKTAKADAPNIPGWYKILAGFRLFEETVLLANRTNSVNDSTLDLYLKALLETGRTDELNATIDLLELARMQQMTNDQRIRLIPVLYRTGHFDKARQLFNTVPAEELILSSETEDSVNLFMLAKLEQHGLKLLKKMSGSDYKDASKPTSRAWAILAAGTNNSALVPWLDSAHNLNKSLLLDCYNIAYKNKHVQISLLLAKRLFSIGKNEQHAIILAEAYLLNRQYNQAMDFLGTLDTMTEQTRQLYLSAISRQINDNSRMVTTQQKAKLADISSYYLRNPKTSDALKRELGYIYSDLHMHKTAREIFMPLAEHAPVDSPDIEQLLYLCGNSLPDEILTWAKKRAAKAAKNELNSWYRIFNDKNSHGAVIAQVESDGKKYDLHIVDQYCRALQMNGQNQRIGEIIAELTPKDYQNIKMRQRCVLIVVYNRAGHSEPAKELFHSVPENELIKASGPLDLAELYILAGKEEYALRRFKELGANEINDAQSKVLQAWAILSAGLGKEEQLVNWLENATNIDPSLIEACFSFAMRYNKNTLTLTLARFMYNIEVSDKTRRYLAEAYIANKKYQKALALLTPMDINHPITQDLYLTAVNSIVYSKSSTNVVQYKRRSIDIAELILKTDPVDTERKRQVGYVFSALELRGRAIEIFLDLARDKSAFSSDVEQLVFLIGKDGWPAATPWFEAQARQTSGDEQLKWFKHLNSTGNAHIVVKIVESGGKNNE